MLVAGIVIGGVLLLTGVAEVIGGYWDRRAGAPESPGDG